MTIADQYTRLGEEISTKTAVGMHIAREIGTGKAHVAKMDAIPTRQMRS